MIERDQIISSMSVEELVMYQAIGGRVPVGRIAEVEKKIRQHLAESGNRIIHIEKPDRAHAV
jgi:hypothetical protein